MKLCPGKTWLLGRKFYSYICLCINIWHVMTVSFKLKRFLASCVYNVILQSGSWRTSFRSLNFFFLPKKAKNKIFHMKIFIRFVKSTMVFFFFYTLKMNINVGVILGSSSGFCVSSVNYVISCKLFRVRLKVGQNWRTRPGLLLSLIRSFRTAGSAPLGPCRLSLLRCCH